MHRGRIVGKLKHRRNELLAVQLMGHRHGRLKCATRDRCMSISVLGQQRRCFFSRRILQALGGCRHGHLAVFRPSNALQEKICIRLLLVGETSLRPREMQR